MLYWTGLHLHMAFCSTQNTAHASIQSCVACAQPFSYLGRAKNYGSVTTHVGFVRRDDLIVEPAPLGSPYTLPEPGKRPYSYSRPFLPLKHTITQDFPYSSCALGTDLIA